MTDQIKYAESKIEFYKQAMLDADESMQDYYYQKALGWIRHRADLANKN
ncbi:MAG TPA: hypothetical protein VLA13_05690 [Massilibacterium sp.]|nr:hypothetical protein [Massilibacterium sp.]